MKYLAYWNFLQLKRGGTPGAEGYISKVLWSELNPTDERVRACVAGAAGSIDRSFRPRGRPGRWQYGSCESRGNTIEEGTSEIQRGMIAERPLGLSRAIELLKLMMDLAAQ
jgi:alkylation response protein AidB-like acyl-CoA dehydrogenase